MFILVLRCPLGLLQLYIFYVLFWLFIVLHVIAGLNVHISFFFYGALFGIRQVWLLDRKLVLIYISFPLLSEF